MHSLSSSGVIVGTALVVWSVVFRETLLYPFFWDDLHYIRRYSWSELLSTFYSWNDPDHIETPALRPIATLTFAAQSALFGDHMVLQHVAMLALMAVLFLALWLLFLELRLDRRHFALVIALFVASRTFSTVVLWLTNGQLIVCYIAMTLAAVTYIRWLSRSRASYLWATLALTVAAAFTREEAYSLVLVLPLVWWISRPPDLQWRRALRGAAAVALIVIAHAGLRHFAVPTAPSIEWSIVRMKEVAIAIASAAMPGGYMRHGTLDVVAGRLWMIFFAALALSQLRPGTRNAREQFLGLCVLGVVLSSPALVVPRALGTTMPALAFATAVSVAALDLRERLVAAPARQRYVVTIVLASGLALGIGSGIRRSKYVAEALHPNAAHRAMWDAHFLLGIYGPATIPEARRREGLARLADLGIRSTLDVKELARRLAPPAPDLVANRETRAGLFAEEYSYLAF